MASVRCSPNISICEEKFNVGKPNKPNIAILCNGGCYRAMIGSAAFVQALQKIDVLPIANYLMTLSGSTWFLASWLCHLALYNDDVALSLSKTKDYLKAAVVESPI